MAGKLSADTMFKLYCKNNYHFADLVNTAVFNGQEMICPEKLHELDSESSDMIDAGQKAVMTISRLRDRLKEIDMGDFILVIGIESQKTIDASMPCRVLLYDAVQLDLHDKAKPYVVMTLVIYLGQEKWNQGKSLLEAVRLPAKYRDGMNDWKMHLLEINHVNPKKFKNKDNQLMVELIQKLYVWDGNRDAFQGMALTREIILTAASATNSLKILDAVQSIEDKQMEGEMLMCQAVDRVLERERRKGLLEGRQEGLLEGRQEGLLEGRQEGLLEGRQVGLLEGKQAGLLEGKQMGKKEALFEIVMELLRLRLGVVSTDLMNKISGLDLPLLKSLFIKIMGASSQQDIMDILN